MKRYPRQYAHEYKQWTNKINAQNHKTHLSPVICLQISKYQEAKVSKKVHTDTGDDILPKLEEDDIDDESDKEDNRGDFAHHTVSGLRYF